MGYCWLSVALWNSLLELALSLDMLFYGMVANNHGFNDVFQSTYNKYLVYLSKVRETAIL